MKDDWWAEVERLYHAARELNPEQRSRFLEEAVAQDSAMRRQIEALLGQNDKSGSFLSKPAISLHAMTLTPGTRIGPYEVAGAIGAGGMGEVYRARDVRLKREVAIKALPEEFAQDAERVARFHREAQLLAALNHPNIASIYDVQESKGAQFLVLEFVEGETLADIIKKRGALPADEAVHIAKQVCDAIEAAHEKGVIHRDLKPANIKITPDGKVKVLDFGLAKTRERAGANADMSNSPTLSPGGTLPGVILGTAGYMSPEQARGFDAGQQSDIFSLGSVLYEMLTGRRAFPGETLSDTIAAILEREPDWTTLPEGTPATVRRLLARCLEKDPRQRLRDIGDAGLDLDDALIAPVTAAAAPSRRWLPHARWVFLAASLFAGALAGTFFLRREPSAPSQVFQLNIDLPAGVQLARFNEGNGATVVLSPDGKRLVVVGQEANGHTRLFVRPLDRPGATPIPGTDGASGPFFSPDGQWIGFSADGRLKKIPPSGGEATVLCDTTLERGANWGTDGNIVFSSGNGGLFQVPAEGGRPRQLTVPDASKGETVHMSPSLVPGGKAVLFTIQYIGNGRLLGDRSVAILSLDTGQWKTLVPGATAPKFMRGGFLVINRGGSLEAAPFDVTRLILTDSPKPLLGDLSSDVSQRKDISYDIAESGGSLVYAAAPAIPSDRGVYTLDRQGRAELVAAELRSYWHPALSRDGSKLAVNVQIAPNASEIWVFDLSRKVWVRMTSGGNDWEPVWEPSGRNIIYGSGRNHGADIWDIYGIEAGGSGIPKLLTTFRRQITSKAVAPDAATLIFDVKGGSTGELWLQRLDGENAARPFLAAHANEYVHTQSFSPDGRWLAYESDVTGRREIYVTDFPDGNSRHPISTSGGRFPCWSRGGQELFYWAGRNMMTVPVKVKGDFEAGPPRRLFESPEELSASDFDVAPDDSHFFVIGVSGTHIEPSQIVFVPGFSAAFMRRLKEK